MTSHCKISVPLAPKTSAVTDRLIVGQSVQMQAIKRQITVIGASDASVLVRGETGTGKERAAEALHAASGRTGPLVAVNCAAIPSELLESELFGHEKGAFTGADQRRLGRFEQAQGGTLFLDEIGDMPQALQAKLLRVLETRKLRRLGASQDIDVDFRLVCATHRDIANAEHFRADLYFRIAVFELELPALRERPDDIPVLSQYLLTAQDDGTPLPVFDHSAMRALSAFHWPGNIRELKNVITRARVLCAGQMVNAQIVRDVLLSNKAAGPDRPAPLPQTQGLPDPNCFRTDFSDTPDLDMRCYLRDIEIALIDAALQHHQGCVTRAADALRLRRTTLIEKMKKYGIEKAT